METKVDLSKYRLAILVDSGTGECLVTEYGCLIGMVNTLTLHASPEGVTYNISKKIPCGSIGEKDDS